MNILGRATALLQVLARTPGKPMSVQEISCTAELPPSTCTRVLKQLVSLDWVDQQGNRGAYRLGPLAYGLAENSTYAPGFLKSAVSVMRPLAKKYPNAGLILVAARSWGQQVLWQCGGEYGDQGAWPQIHQQPWHGACSRVLVAYMSPSARRSWINRLGLPTPQQWEGVLSRRELLEELRAIRRAGYAETGKDGIHAVAIPIITNGIATASLGIYATSGEYRQGMTEDVLNVRADLYAPQPT